MRHPSLLIAAVSTLALLAACGGDDQAAGDAALAAKAAELQQKEAQLAEREAALVAQGTPATADADEPSSPTVTSSDSKVVAQKPAASSKPVAKPATTATPPKPVAPRIVTVPAGTALPLSLAGALSTKNAKVGDAVRATVTDDVLVDGRVAIARGATVAGQVVKVVSGSDKIGGVPTLVMGFERLELSGGKEVPLAGEITQSGKSDTGRDTAKIVGGVAAGAIIGGQVSKGDKGKVIGGLLGGAAGAAAAQKTGTEVVLAEGAAMNLTLSAPVEITK
jgi:hypothetical protein